MDLSGEWNDVDADLVAEALIVDLMRDAWAEEWAAKQGRKPVVRLYPIRNKSDGYIDYRYFTKQVEVALLKSKRVEVVASLEEAEDARGERDDQAIHASDDTAKSHQQEAGSDFILNGWLVTQNDGAGNTAVKAYLTTMELVETQTQKKAWAGQKKIKKKVSK